MYRQKSRQPLVGLGQQPDVPNIVRGKFLCKIILPSVVRAPGVKFFSTVDGPSFRASECPGAGGEAQRAEVATGQSVTTAVEP